MITPNDLHAVSVATGEVTEFEAAARTVFADVKRARVERLWELGLRPEGEAEETDFVIIAVPKGRAHQVQEALLTIGFAHGDVGERRP